MLAQACFECALMVGWKLCCDLMVSGSDSYHVMEVKGNQECLSVEQLELQEANLF